jgi:predicted DNA-binding transcriptional regulator YafY
MSINKNAFIRYQTLDRCFRSRGRKYYIENLLDECNETLLEANPKSSGIRKRQLFEDIRFMESDQGWSIPLERHKDGSRIWYRYSDHRFSINNQPLKSEDKEKIRSALDVLSRFSGLPQFQWVDDLVPVLKDKLGLLQPAKKVISFHENLDYTGSTNIPLIFDAIVNRQCLLIHYKPFTQEALAPFHFHPYYLKEYNSRWFAFGLNQEMNVKTWNIPLDRIQHAKSTNTPYIYHDIDWDEYFYDIIGVSRPFDSEPVQVKLWISQLLTPYVRTKPLHPSQKSLKEFENGYETSITVIINNELISLILSNGENIKVLSPDELKETVKNRIKGSLDRYSENLEIE